MMRQRLPIALAALLCLAGFAALLARPPPAFLLLQERVFDGVLRLASAKATPRVQVIDIAEVDDQGLPWGRAATARPTCSSSRCPVASASVSSEAAIPRRRTARLAAGRWYVT